MGYKDIMLGEGSKTKRPKNAHFHFSDLPKTDSLWMRKSRLQVWRAGD
jgi:hypothetical protein